MHNAVKISAVLVAACTVFGSQAFAQVPPPPPPPPAHHGLFSRVFHHPAASSISVGSTAPLSGGIVGNKKSHVYHLPGDTGSLPALQNRVYFHTAAEAQAAGYHAAGSGAHKMGHSLTHPLLHHAPLPGAPMR